MRKLILKLIEWCEIRAALRKRRKEARRNRKYVS